MNMKGLLGNLVKQAKELDLCSIKPLSLESLHVGWLTYSQSIGSISVIKKTVVP